MPYYSGEKGPTGVVGSGRVLFARALPLLFFKGKGWVGIIVPTSHPQMSKAQLPPIFLYRKGRHLHSLMVIPLTRCITLLHPALTEQMGECILDITPGRITYLLLLPPGR